MNFSVIVDGPSKKKSVIVDDGFFWPADFKYNKGSDSVLVVNKQDYDSCNTKNPILKLDDGDSTFKFDKSGPFFFISGIVENCQKGEKLIVVVLSPNHHHTPPSPTTVAPAPSHSADNAPSPSAADKTAPTTSPISENSPEPSPAHSGSHRFRGSVGVGVALVLATFVF